MAKSTQLNKVGRQSAFMSAVLAQFIADQSNQDVLDDGNFNKMLPLFNSALSAYLQGNLGEV